MENPVEEVAHVVLRLAASSSPEVQTSTVEEYMTSDVAFRHPVCSIESGPDSRTKLLGLYRWYRVLSPYVELRVKGVVWDQEHNYVYLDVVQWFKLVFLPIKPTPARLCVRLTLRRGDNGLYYIAMQEDFYHPDEFMALLFPALVPLVRLLLVFTGFIAVLLSRLAKPLAFRRRTSKVDDSGTHTGTTSDGDLYSNAGDKDD